MTDTNIEYKVPAENLAEIKQGLISLGYATEETSMEFIQDCYFKYILVRQTGFNPHIPYAVALLPKELREQLTGGENGGTDPELPVFKIALNSVTQKGLNLICNVTVDKPEGPVLFEAQVMGEYPGGSRVIGSVKYNERSTEVQSGVPFDVTLEVGEAVEILNVYAKLQDHDNGQGFTSENITVTVYSVM